MIIEAFTQTYTRLRYLNVATTSILDYKPDGRPATHVATLTTGAKVALTTALAQKVTASSTRGELLTMQATAHDQVVMVHACMRSCYRHDRASLDSIRAVPTEDKSPADTLHRMKELSAVWASLPNVPGTGELFAVRGITKASFDTLMEDLDAKISESTKEGVLLGNQEARLRVLNTQTEDFITAALIQGRAQYPAGTPERAFIEAVPTEPSTQKPGQAEITKAESPAEGEVLLEFDAAHATSFQVWHKGPGGGAVRADRGFDPAGKFFGGGPAGGEPRVSGGGIEFARRWSGEPRSHGAGGGCRGSGVRDRVRRATRKRWFRQGGRGCRADAYAAKRW